MIEEPSKIKLNVAKGLVESCYFPIVQSGGVYDLKVLLSHRGFPMTDDFVAVVSLV